jgi:FkbM family methyltransferase
MQIAREHGAVVPLAAYVGRKIVVADVGCRWGVSDVWTSFGPHVTILGFDPDADECARLAQLDHGGLDVRFVPRALGPANGPARLYLTRQPACSSLYPPHAETLRHRPELACAEPVGTTMIELTTLDGWAEQAGIGAIDVMKLDTQGSELGVLQGAERCLASVRGMELEVEFNEIYSGQPLFGDVDAFLRRRGFVLWRLGHLVHYGMAESRSDYAVVDHQCFDSRWVAFPSQGGQISWGHAYYVRREIAFEGAKQDWRDSLRDACVLSAWGFRDLAGRGLRMALDLAPAEVAPAIWQALGD